MDVSYQRDMNHNYLILKCDGELSEESYETRMIFANNIPGLLPCHIRYIDGRTYLGYDVTSRQSLNLFCESRKPGRKEIKKILGSILGTILGMEEFLLDPDHLILDPELIHMNFETQETVLAFAPFYRKEVRSSLRELTEYLLTFIARDDQEGIVLGYRFSHELTETNAGTLELMNVLNGKKYVKSVDRAYSPADRGGPGKSETGFVNTELSGESSEIRKIMYEEDGSGPDECYIGPGTHDKSGSVDFLMEENTVSQPEPGKRVRNNSKKHKAAGRTGLVVIIGLATACVLYIAIHYAVPNISGFGYIVRRIAAAVLICAGAVGAGLYLRKRKNHELRNDAGISSEYGGLKQEIAKTAEDEGEKFGNGKNQDESSFEEYSAGYEGLRSAGDYTAGCYGASVQATDLLTGILQEESASAVIVPEDSSAEYPLITLSENEVLIGKQKDLVTFVIDSPAVSRLHARIRHGNDGYYLRDLNSTNGTSVNGEAVFGNEEVRISEGDRITFADIVYIMK